MAKTVTLADLLADVRALYESHSIRLDDTLLTRWINKSIALLWDHIVAVNPDHFLSDDTITVVSGTDEYNMASEIADFYKGHGASVLLETGKYSPIGTFPWEERHLYANTTVARAQQLYRYMGSKLYLAPVPSWAGTLKVFYIPTATVLVGGGSPNSVDFFNSWDEFVVYDVALKCAVSEESTTADLRESRNQLLNDIQSFAYSTRDTSHNDRIRDVRLEGRAQDPFSRLPWPG